MMIASQTVAKLCFSTSAKSAIGFIGLGNMGFPMAKNLVQSGHEIVCFDKNLKQSAKLCDLGAVTASSPIELVEQVSTVISVLPNDQVLNSIFEEFQLLDHFQANTLHISCSTISPDTARELSRKHLSLQHQYVAAPIFARPDGMEAKMANFILSSSKQDSIERAMEILECTSFGCHDFGAYDPGAANVVKLCGNFLIGASIESMAEACSLAEANGLSRADVMDFYRSTFFDCPIYKGYGYRVSRRDHREGGFALDLGYKDMNLVRDTALKANTPMPFLSVLLDRFLAAKGKRRGELDWSAIGLEVCETRGIDVSDFVEKSRGDNMDTNNSGGCQETANR